VSSVTNISAGPPIRKAVGKAGHCFKKLSILSAAKEYYYILTD